MVRIEVDPRSGFCTGVIKAVRTAEEHLETEGTLCSLGELVHNPEEVRRLGERGLQPISYEDFEELEEADVLIRAHGEPPSTFRKAREKNLRLIDATCPIVRNLQKKIRDCTRSLPGKRGSILIFGKKDHPEVRALVGHTEGRARVVRDPGELLGMDLDPPVFLFSQTTMNMKEFLAFQESLKKHLGKKGMAGGLKIYNTVCRQVSSREKYLKDFVGCYELVFFVSGKQSSNGKALFKICREVNPNTHFISDPGESDAVEVKGTDSIGICGATSTPGWLLDAVRDRLEKRLGKIRS